MGNREMYLKKQSEPGVVVLPDGQVMTRADLPPAETQRWVASRKAAVVRGIASGLISIKEAMATYDLSAEELESWTAAIGRHGIAALKTTRIQEYRQP